MAEILADINVIIIKRQVNIKAMRCLRKIIYPSYFLLNANAIRRFDLEGFRYNSCSEIEIS